MLAKLYMASFVFHHKYRVVGASSDYLLPGRKHFLFAVDQLRPETTNYLVLTKETEK